MKKLVFASMNTGKVKEIQALLSPLGIDIVSQSEFDVPEIEETGLSFIENAILKARNAARHTGFAALADDSGLCVEALNGAPGIYSARFAGTAKDDDANISKLLSVLDGQHKRAAAFKCVLALVRTYDDPVPVICEGELCGRISRDRKGKHGFGYDPVFYPENHTKTLAEFSAQEKNKISHRACAFLQMRAYFTGLCR